MQVLWLLSYSLYSTCNSSPWFLSRSVHECCPQVSVLSAAHGADSHIEGWQRCVAQVLADAGLVSVLPLLSAVLSSMTPLLQ